MIFYEKVLCADGSDIDVRRIPARGEDRAGSREDMHRHHFYEILLVESGGCEVLTPDKRLFLIPGDALVLAAEQPHACVCPKGAAVYQCRFAAPAGAGELRSLMEDGPDAAAGHAPDLQQRIRDLHAFEANPLEHAAQGPQDAPAHNRLIHLGDEGAAMARRICRELLDEQERQAEGAAQMKRLYLQQLLILLRRMRAQRDEAAQERSWKQAMVDAVLRQIDQDFAQPIDFAAVARRQGITPAYFRSVFKGMVGMPPTDYLTRVRILKSLELLQTTQLPIAEIAAQVGIDDANYFSRLFKKTVGYPPRYFKAISSQAGRP